MTIAPLGGQCGAPRVTAPPEPMPLADGTHEGVMKWNTFEVDVEYQVDGGQVDEITELEPRDMPGLTLAVNGEAIITAAKQWAFKDAEKRAEEQDDD